MSMFTAASSASVWRGYHYFQEEKVISWTKLCENEFAGEVTGSGTNKYQVMFDALTEEEENDYYY